MADLVAEVADWMRTQAEDDEHDLIPRLIASGVEGPLAVALVAVIPLAFGRIIMERTGATLSGPYLLHDSSGRPLGRYRLLDHPVYRKAYRTAKEWTVRGIGGGDFLAVAGRNPEVRCLNQALEKGSEPKALPFGEPLMQGAIPPREKKGWRFWRWLV